MSGQGTEVRGRPRTPATIREKTLFDMDELCLQIRESPLRQPRKAIEGGGEQRQGEQRGEDERVIELAARDDEQPAQALIADDELADHRAGDRERQAGAQIPARMLGSARGNSM